MKHKVMTVVGARPQFIKASPVSAALRQAGLTEILVHTGQHFDPMMSDVFFRELGLNAPDRNLDIHSLGHGAMTGRMLEGIEAAILEERPDLMLVYGDTNSTLAGALAAAKLHIPVAHVEAGLRSFNRRMPEEINRVSTDHISTLLFCPTATALANLAQEGLTQGVFATGDVMYDAALWAASRAEGTSDILQRLRLQRGSYGVATVHRAENTDDRDRFSRILAFLARQAEERPLILVAHPRSAKLIHGRETELGRVLVIAPLGYLDMTWLISNAAQLITDSGGLQKEAYFHRVPCVTLRDETEWLETITNGWNRLWTKMDYLPRHEIPDYGNGTSASQIAGYIQSFLDNRS